MLRDTTCRFVWASLRISHCSFAFRTTLPCMTACYFFCSSMWGSKVDRCPVWAVWATCYFIGSGFRRFESPFGALDNSPLCTRPASISISRVTFKRVDRLFLEFVLSLPLVCGFKGGVRRKTSRCAGGESAQRRLTQRSLCHSDKGEAIHGSKKQKPTNDLPHPPAGNCQKAR